ncbi:roadblock/LC7 domain-containing protein [Streptomyces sp. ZYX-F-203]
MTTADSVHDAEEIETVRRLLHRLRQDARAKGVLLVDRSGGLLGAAGEAERYDTTSLAALTAGRVDAVDGPSELIRERELSVMCHEGRRDHLHLSIVANRALLLVAFDERSSSGLVRLRVERADSDLAGALRAMSERTVPAGGAAMPEITEGDLRALLGD